MRNTPYLYILVLFAFLANTLGPLPAAQAQEFYLPAPGVMVRLSPPLDPPILKGIKVHSDNPFRFEFILDKGDIELNNDQLKDESGKLIKYFLASLTIPEKDLWVNLSPYEKDRVITQSFGFTEMGRDLLAEDYMLKQITASLIYPEGETGKIFWKRVYAEAVKKFGTTNIPVNTFNKVWIVPDKAVVYENSKAGTAYVVESTLKVMLEQDYLAASKHANIGATETLDNQIVREIVIPELTREVNNDKNFVRLRQVYNSLILAAWYKKKIRDSILEQVYADKNKTSGLSFPKTSIGNPQYIYQQYLQAFKKGVFNYIKEEPDSMTQEMVPRKYFSGGVKFGDLAMITTTDPAMLPQETGRDAVIEADIQTVDRSMSGDWQEGSQLIEEILNEFNARINPLSADKSKHADGIIHVIHTQIVIVYNTFKEAMSRQRINDDQKAKINEALNILSYYLERYSDYNNFGKVKEWAQGFLENYKKLSYTDKFRFLTLYELAIFSNGQGYTQETADRIKAVKDVYDRNAGPIRKLLAIESKSTGTDAAMAIISRRKLLAAGIVTGTAAVVGGGFVAKEDVDLYKEIKSRLIPEPRTKHTPAESMNIIRQAFANGNLDNLFNARRKQPDDLSWSLSQIQENQMKEFSRYFATLQPGIRQQVFMVLKNRMREDFSTLDKARSRRAWPDTLTRIYDELSEQAEHMRLLYSRMMTMLNRIDSDSAKDPEGPLLIKAIPDDNVAPFSIVAMTRQQSVDGIHQSIMDAINLNRSKGRKVFFRPPAQVNVSQIAELMKDGRLDQLTLLPTVGNLTQWVEATTNPNNPKAHRITQQELLTQAMELNFDPLTKSIDLFRTIITIIEYLGTEGKTSNYLWYRFDHGWLMGLLDSGNGQVDDQGRPVKRWRMVNENGLATIPPGEKTGIRRYPSTFNDFYPSWVALLLSYYTTVKNEDSLRKDFESALKDEPGAALPQNTEILDDLYHLKTNRSFVVNSYIALPVFLKKMLQDPRFFEKVQLGQLFTPTDQKSWGVFAAVGRMLAKDRVASFNDAAMVSNVNVSGVNDWILNGSIDDIQPEIVRYKDLNSKPVEEIEGLKNKVIIHLKDGRTIFIADHHNHAFSFWWLMMKEGRLKESGNNILHIDAHADARMRDKLKPEVENVFKGNNLLDVDELSKNLGIEGFIAPLAESGFISDWHWLYNLHGGKAARMEKKTEGQYAISDSKANPDDLNYEILDVDIDVLSQGFTEEESQPYLRSFADMAKKAKVISIVTSPEFIDQNQALKYIKTLVAYIVAQDSQGNADTAMAAANIDRELANEIGKAKAGLPKTRSGIARVELPYSSDFYDWNQLLARVYIQRMKVCIVPEYTDPKKRELQLKLLDLIQKEEGFSVAEVADNQGLSTHKEIIAGEKALVDKVVAVFDTFRRKSWGEGFYLRLGMALDYPIATIHRQYTRMIYEKFKSYHDESSYMKWENRQFHVYRHSKFTNIVEKGAIREDVDDSVELARERLGGLAADFTVVDDDGHLVVLQRWVDYNFRDLFDAAVAERNWDKVGSLLDQFFQFNEKLLKRGVFNWDFKMENYGIDQEGKMFLLDIGSLLDVYKAEDRIIAADILLNRNIFDKPEEAKSLYYTAMEKYGFFNEASIKNKIEEAKRSPVLVKVRVNEAAFLTEIANRIFDLEHLDGAMLGRSAETNIKMVRSKEEINEIISHWMMEKRHINLQESSIQERIKDSSNNGVVLLYTGQSDNPTGVLLALGEKLQDKKYLWSIDAVEITVKGQRLGQNLVANFVEQFGRSNWIETDLVTLDGGQKPWVDFHKSLGFYKSSSYGYTRKPQPLSDGDKAQLVNGGIDLTPANMNLQVNQGMEGLGGIQFHLNPAMLQQLQNAPGFVPVIISVKPLADLQRFLGIVNQNK